MPWRRNAVRRCRIGEIDSRSPQLEAMSPPLRYGRSRCGLTAGDADRAVLTVAGRSPPVTQAVTNPPTR